jgi:hypothetical protein
LSDISADILNIETKNRSEFLSTAELKRAKTCENNLRHGASSFQKSELPPCFENNAPGIEKFGKEVSDTIASWILKKFAAGPFDTPPLEKFRVNPLIAIQQNGKVRPVLNMSEPKGNSFNENVESVKLEKVFMSSSKQFSKSLFDAGKNASFSKFDFVDAYKNVPVKIFDLRLQGFVWKDKFFVETRQIFGASTAVQNFDILANTLVTLANSKVKVPKKYVHRTLDDVPIISPACRKWAEEFSAEFTELCEKCGAKLAPNCEKFEKAFVNSKYGKVLGTFFDTEKLAWKTPTDKRTKYLNKIKQVYEAASVGLEDMQQLMGSLNHAGQLSPFMNGFRYNLNKCLGQLQSNPESKIYMSKEAKYELRVWANFLQDEEWQPLAGAYCNPPLACKEFVSDAAGSAKMARNKDRLGCGNLGFDHSGIIIFAHQLWWPRGVLENHVDKKGKQFGSKTTTLEFLGILIPFLLIPDQMIGQHVIVKVDNTGCYYGWLNKNSPNDETASILIRTLHLISCFLECQVHIQHLPRNSNWEAQVVDRLSRESTTTHNDRRLLNSFPKFRLPVKLLNWMENPVEDWDMPQYLLNYVINAIKS